jgi:hypothetical protein
MDFFEQPPSPESFELNALECCALQTAFVKNPDVVRQLEDLAGRRELGVIKEELQETSYLSLIADPITKAIYTQLAEAELKRLQETTDRFSCGHSGEEHERALRSVISTCAAPIN